MVSCHGAELSCGDGGGRLRAPQSLVKNSSGSLSRERPFGSVSGFWPNWHRGAAGTRSGDAPTAAIRAIGCSCKADAPASTRRDRRMRAKAMLSRQGKLSAALCWRRVFSIGDTSGSTPRLIRSLRVVRWKCPPTPTPTARAVRGLWLRKMLSRRRVAALLLVLAPSGAYLLSPQRAPQRALLSSTALRHSAVAACTDSESVADTLEDLNWCATQGSNLGLTGCIRPERVVAELLARANRSELGSCLGQAADQAEQSCGRRGL